MKNLRKYSKKCHMHFGVNLIVNDTNFNEFLVFSLFQNYLEKPHNSYYFMNYSIDNYKFSFEYMRLKSMPRCLER